MHMIMRRFTETQAFQEIADMNWPRGTYKVALLDIRLRDIDAFVEK